jgi:hypothetical protein
MVVSSSLGEGGSSKRANGFARPGRDLHVTQRVSNPRAAAAE